MNTMIVIVDVRDFDDMALKHNIFILRVYFKNINLMNLFKVYFKKLWCMCMCTTIIFKF